MVSWRRIPIFPVNLVNGFDDGFCFFDINVKKVSSVGGGGAVYSCSLFCALIVVPPTRLLVAVSRRGTSDSVMASLPASVSSFFEQLAVMPDVSEEGCRAPRADAHYFVIGKPGQGEC